MTIAATATQHTVTRLDITTGMPFDTFRDAFETAAPVFDSGAVADLTARGGSWDDVRAVVAANAPHGLMIFSSIDAAPLMAAAGHGTRAVEYLLGNHVIAEQMSRHSPLALLYAPLRILIHGDEADEAVFSLDQPSTLFGSLGDPRISAVGRELDGKVSNLLTNASAASTPMIASRLLTLPSSSRPT